MYILAASLSCTDYIIFILFSYPHEASFSSQNVFHERWLKVCSRRQKLRTACSLDFVQLDNYLSSYKFL